MSVPANFTVDFFELRRVLLELERKGIATSSLDLAIAVPRTYSDRKEITLAPPPQKATFYGLRPEGVACLNAIRDEQKLQDLLDYAERKGQPLTCDNLKILTEEMRELVKKRPLIFISWSGEEEREIARALQVFFESVLPVKTFVSARDIHSNHESWRSTIESHLKEARYGIICMTSRNRHAPWLMYESGALEMKLDFRNITVLLLGMNVEMLPAPLNHKHIRMFDKQGFTCMLEDVCSGLSLPMPKLSKPDWNKLRNKVKSRIKLIPQGESDGMNTTSSDLEESQAVSSRGESDAQRESVRKVFTPSLEIINSQDFLNETIYLEVTDKHGISYDGNIMKCGSYIATIGARAVNMIRDGRVRVVDEELSVHVGIKEELEHRGMPCFPNTVTTMPLADAVFHSRMGRLEILPPDWVCFCSQVIEKAYGYGKDRMVNKFRFIPRSEAEELASKGLGHINY